MDQVFNELSLSASLPDDHAAHAALLELKKASDKLKALGFSPQIRVTEDFAVRHVTPGCTIRDYLKSSAAGKDKTLRQWLLTRFSSAPYVEQLCADAGMTILEEYVIGKDVVCKGLALASLWDIPALSLAGDARFVPPYVTLTRNSLTEADSAVSEEECQVGLICGEEDIPRHEESIKARFYEPTNTGKELLDYAHRRLTHLLFSDVAEDQLERMLQGHILLPRIRIILEELQRAMQEAVVTRNFCPKGFKYTPAEGDTATQGKKGQKHTFTFNATGRQGGSLTVDLLCESHMRINGGYRVYFYADNGEKTVYVGHIGKHLPGKKFG